MGCTRSRGPVNPVVIPASLLVLDCGDGSANMKISCTISFWSDDVGCFCHEAITRALHRTFGDCKINENDLAFDKFAAAANASELLASSAWLEFLRNGPSRAFTLPSGISGRFSRYRIEFNVPPQTPDIEIRALRSFLNSLKLGETQLEELE